MDLGFAVNKGPLSQISLSIASFNTAAHLATGAYGWWKARNRALSLTEVVASEHGQLSACSTFSRPAYALVRSRGQMRGVTLNAGQLESLDLPSTASTAMDGDSGLMCLRALTTGLLCLFDVAAATSILAQVIPTTLINYDLEGESMKIEGPLLGSLRQYVSAVALEEDSNTFRLDTMRILQESLAKLSHAPSNTSFRHTFVTPVEHPLITGLLQWSLTSPYKRACIHYPTRSLTAWSMALILSHLGFEISASYRTISTPDLYTTYVSPSNNSGTAEVFLVTCNYGDTDPLESIAINSGYDGGLKPRILPIKAIPWIAFRHLGHGDGHHSTGYLSDVWDYSFKHALSAFGTPTVTPDGTIQLPISRHDDTIHGYHKDILGLWNPQMSKVLGSPMQQFVPMMAGVLDDVQRFSDGIFSSAREDVILSGGQGAVSWYCISAIVLATIYAAVCKSLHSTSGADQHIEVAVPPDILFSNKPYKWAVVVGGAIDSVTTCLEWTKMMLEICTAIEFPRTAFDGNSYHNVREYPSRAPPSLSDVFGAQANGVVLASDFLLNPSVNPASLATYHIQYGQSLHLPHDSDGLMKAPSINAQARMICLDPQPEYTVLESGKSAVNVRIDVAPDWERDPRTLSFHARVGGIHRYTFSPLTVARRLTSAVIACQCSRNMSSLDVPLHQRWQPVTMSQLFEPTIGGSSPNSRLAIEVGNYVCIQADGDLASQLLCLGVMEGQAVVLATECLDCAYRKLFLTRVGQSVQPNEAILISGLM